MGRGGHGFKRHWDRRELELVDGTVLSWIAMLDREPGRVECFAVDGQPIHPSVGVAHLATAGHPDAQLRSPDESTLGGGRVSR